MSGLPRPVGPRAALRRPRAPSCAQRSREQVIGAALAVLVTIIIVIIFFVDSKINTAPPPQIVYVEQWTRQPHRRRDHRRPEEGPGGKRTRGRGSAAASSSRSSRNSSACERATARLMAEAVALGEGARGRTAPNPNVGCVIVTDGEIVGRGATAPGGRPHAEAVALAEAGAKAQRRDALHHARALRPRQRARPDLRRPASPRPASPASSIALKDPDPRTAGKGIERLRKAGIEVKVGVGARGRAAIAGRLSHPARARPAAHHAQARAVDRRQDRAAVGRIANGSPARMRARHVHLERAHSDMILVGRGTYLADQPRLDVRLPGLEDRSPRRALLTRGEAVDGWEILAISAGCAIDFMTSTTCWSRAARRPPPPSSPPIWSTGS